MGRKFGNTGASGDNKEELKRVFKLYGEKNGVTRLYKDDLKNAFEYLGALMPTYKAASALRYIDTDNSGYISGDELEALVEYARSSGFR
ncbi:hypothetical protein QQP08_023103 [Theobroma cacao]|uniref:EF-hand domain-containing protein n=1 Tax=Theobroma cacao TaxID=3641 RepID=A0A061FAW5_THECC|nr:Uncharacterized protein TCM_033860 [Theobroma cacao]WRX30616.1 hypothetical protein QQP08_023103 [Theobroma cacao]